MIQWTAMEQKGPVAESRPREAATDTHVFIIALDQVLLVNGQSFHPGQLNGFYLAADPISVDFPGTAKSRALLLYGNADNLSVYAACCQRLQSFIAGKEPLLAAPAFMSLDMQGLVKKLLSAEGDKSLAALYAQSILQQWFTLLCIQLNLVRDQPCFPASALAAAMEAKRIIVADFEIMHTVEQLARQTGITEAGLQAAFRHLYGTTVAQFSRQARLEEAHRILSTTTYPLRVVCLMVGYPDASNFSVAFKNQYGYWPGRIQKKLG